MQHEWDLQLYASGKGICGDMHAGMEFKVICKREWDLQLYASWKGICGDMQAGMGFKGI